ncbi:MAG: iron-containing alcohol dehydrogenase [Butyrivibrio sp.]
MKRIPEILDKLGAKSVFIISGPNLNKMGVVSRISDICTNYGASVSAFTETEGNPGTETVEHAAEELKRTNADCIIALGGGSPMDVAKAVGIIAKYGGKITDYEGGGKVPGDIIPIIAIPTTAGTGSEVTEFSVITDHSRNYKFTVFSDKLLPSYAVLDPELLAGMPVSVAAATGMDAMVHAIESYISKAGNPFTDCMAEKALELIGKNICRFTADRTNTEAAGEMLLGSTFAGIAFNSARLGVVHAMAHPVGGFFNVPHGVANAVLLPVCLKFNALADNGKYRKIYDCIADKKSDDEFVPEILSDEIKKLTLKLGIPASLSEVGVTPDKIQDMAVDAMKSGNIAVNPRSITIGNIEKLYKEAMN